MPKSLRTAAFVVGAVALVATGVGAAAGAGLFGAAAAAAGGTVAGVSVATIATVGTLASVAAATLSLAAVAISPKGSVGGNATKFKIDKDAGVPYLMGRSYVGGNVVHRTYYGLKNSLESWVAVHSLGPIKSLGPLLIDKVAVGFAAGAAVGAYAGYMWLDQQLGLCPEARALAGPSGPIPGWDATSKLSGLAADLWTLKFDSKGKVFPNGVPERGRVNEGVFVYDMRLDDTYPGGAGPCRIGDEATYVYSENPALHAVTFAYGRFQNGVLVAGGGLPVTGIDLAPFCEWANVCDANGWKVGGIVYTTSDNKWDILKMIAQAGGGEVMPVGALLSCTFSAPRVSIGTIVTDDIIGDIDAPSTASRRDRKNAIMPRIRSEAHGWEMIPLDPVRVPEYEVIDRGRRLREVEYPLVQDKDQGAELAMYDLLDARELDPIVLPCKIYALGYRPGDCVTLDIPEANLIGRPVIIRTRELDMGSFGVTFSCRSETVGKHALALGRTGIAPPTPDLTVPDASVVAAPAPDEWAAVGAALSANGTSIPVIVITGSVENPTAEAVAFEYRPAGSTEWIAGGLEVTSVTRTEITSVTSGTAYDVAVRYRVRGVLGERLTLGPVTVGQLSTGGPLDTGTNFDVVIGATDAGSTATITVSAHQRTYIDIPAVAVAGVTMTGMPYGVRYWLYYDDPQRLGGAVSYVATTAYADAFQSAAHPARHYVGDVTTPVAGGGPTGGGGATPPGGGGGRNPNEPEP